MLTRGIISRVLTLATACGVSAACGVCQADSPGWVLAWEDDFSTFDESKWTRVDTNVPTNKSLQDYLPEQVTVIDGKLSILAEDRPSRGLAFRSGQVRSKSEQRLGRWEVRARMPTSQGMWPAIWLLPDVDRFRWPSGGEIDIMENRGNQPFITSSAFHYGGSQPFVHEFVYEEQQTPSGDELINYHTSFHTYAVDWTERYLRFYVDGVNHFTVHDEDVGHFLSRSTQPMQLVINNAIGGTFLPDPDSSTHWPQTMEVDWVRVYTHAPDDYLVEFINGDFEADGGSLSGWTTFGDSLVNLSNVRTSNEAVASGVAALKVFGPFQEQTTYSGVNQGMSVSAGSEVAASLTRLVRSDDSIIGTDNTAVLKIEFYSDYGAKYGSDAMLGEQSIEIANGTSAEDQWQDYQLIATAPEGAVEARLAIVFVQPGQAGGAMHVDNITFATANSTLQKSAQ